MTRPEGFVGVRNLPIRRSSSATLLPMPIMLLGKCALRRQNCHRRGHWRRKPRTAKTERITATRNAADDIVKSQRPHKAEEPAGNRDSGTSARGSLHRHRRWKNSKRCFWNDCRGHKHAHKRDARRYLQCHPLRFTLVAISPVPDTAHFAILFKTAGRIRKFIVYRPRYCDSIRREW